MVITAKLERDCRLHEIEYEVDDPDRTARIPPEFAALDRSDRKFLAVALADLADGNHSAIINATDTGDWRKIDAPCQAHGVVIRQLLDD